MTRDDIIRMAREAGMPPVEITSDKPVLYPVPDAIERFAALVAEHKQKELDRIFDVLRQISMLTDLGGEVAEYQDVVEAVKRIAVAERERIKQANAPEIERINAHLKTLKEENARYDSECLKLARSWNDAERRFDTLLEASISAVAALSALSSECEKVEQTYETMKAVILELEGAGI